MGEKANRRDIDRDNLPDNLRRMFGLFDDEDDEVNDVDESGDIADEAAAIGNDDGAEEEEEEEEEVEPEDAGGGAVAAGDEDSSAVDNELRPISSSIALVRAPTPKEGDVLGQVLAVSRRVVRPLPKQPRTWFDPELLQLLADSIAEHGQREPVPAIRVHGVPGVEWQLIDGERRWRALELAGLDIIIIREVEETDDPEDLFDAAVVSNLNRAGHTPLEKGRAFARMSQRHSPPVIARMAGVTTGHVYNLISLARMPESVQQLLEPQHEGENRGKPQLGADIALSLKKYPPGLQEKYAHEIVKKGMSRARASAWLRAQDVHRSDGHTSTSRNRPADVFTSLLGVVEHADVGAARFLEMMPQLFNEMFARRSQDDADALGGRCEEIGRKFCDLGERIRKAKE